MQRSSHDFYLISITTSYYIWFLVSNLFLFHFLIPIFPSSACWLYAAVPLRTPFGSSWGPTCYAYGLQWFCRRPRTGDRGPEVSWNTSNRGIFQLLIWLPMRYNPREGENYGKLPTLAKYHFFPCWTIFASLPNLEDTFSHSPLMRFHAAVESENRNVCFLWFCFIPECQEKPQTFCGVWRPNFIRLHSETSYICSGFIQI